MGSKIHYSYNHYDSLVAGVKLKRLSPPFFEEQATLLQPLRLVSTIPVRSNFNNAAAMLHLILSAETKAELKKTDSHLQLILRFCEYNSNSIQVDQYPPGLNVKVNGISVHKSTRICSSEMPQPLNVTTACIKSPTDISLVWIAWSNYSIEREYAVSAYLVKNFPLDYLLRRITIDVTRLPERKRMTDIHDHDSIVATSQKISLICPLSKTKMVYPCKAKPCNHRQCFDAQQFLLYIGKTEDNRCPVCNQYINYDDLRLDGFTKNVIQTLKEKPDIREIELLPNGSWVPIGAPKRKEILELSCSPEPPNKRPRLMNEKVDHHHKDPKCIGKVESSQDYIDLADSPLSQSSSSSTASSTPSPSRFLRYELLRFANQNKESQSITPTHCRRLFPPKTFDVNPHPHRYTTTANTKIGEIEVIDLD